MTLLNRTVEQQCRWTSEENYFFTVMGVEKHVSSNSKSCAD